ncbi:oxidative stress transcriptional regulator AosR [Tomitella biformata]|uniref:oxidative stress transcriptional regulator AosR n=1 Tax=Tomitella biformata TaxID=630403 RepID=UPI0004659E44|nr:DUF2017 domain-containing protein [Tomitella biformata]
MRPWTRKHSLGGVKFRSELDVHEAAVLRSLVASVLAMLDARDADAPQDDLAALTGLRSGNNQAPTDPILKRLLPDFHRPDKDPDSSSARSDENVDINGALRGLHELDIIDAKRQVAKELLRTLPPEGGRVTLSIEEADCWLTAVNDVRLALGSALKIDVDTPDELPEGDPRAADMDVYHWLTWLQDSLVQVMMR